MSGDQTKPSILGLCNPLLDMSANVRQEFLDKYKLKPNGVILAGEEQKDLCQDLRENHMVRFSAGGSAQNVMRIAAGIMQKQRFDCKVMFTGCIGKDDNGYRMSKIAIEEGIVVNYAISDTEPTGTCAVCLTEQGKNRSLCAFLGASQKFTDKHLRDNWQELVENTDIIYISGFLIAVSPESFHLLGEHVAKSLNDKKVFCLNLSAPYVSAAFGNEIDSVMKYVDILFGNDDEALTYANFKQWNTTNIDDIAKKIALDEKVRTSVNRLVVITRGGEPVVVAQQVDKDNVDIKHFPCKPIPSSEMVDTNGAGDSFAGGFLSQFIQNAPLEHCIKVADYAAREIIKIPGVERPNFDDLPQL